MKKLTLTTATLFILSLNGAYAETQKLRYVIDGDTAVFAHTTCRFAYIDTPESKHNKKLESDIKRSQYNKKLHKYILNNNSVSPQEVVRAGRIAKGYVKSIMHKGSFYDFDIISTDRYGRSICVIYDKKGGTINDRIVANGFAVPFWRYIPSNIKPKMIDLVRRAKAKNKGLWRSNRNVMDMMN